MVHYIVRVMVLHIDRVTALYIDYMLSCVYWPKQNLWAYVGLNEVSK